MGMVLLQPAAKMFTQRKFAADFILFNLNFIHKGTINSLFEPPFGKLGVSRVTYIRTSSIARWKARVVNFLFAIIELFC